MNGVFARQPARRGRRKKCRICREWFVAQTSLARACSPKCALALVGRDKAAEQKRKDAATREQLKTRSDYLKEAQKAFNAFIRERDYARPCISSGVNGLGEPLTGGAWDCGHYRSIGANPELRFCELNAHKQTKHDNRQLSGNAVNYRIGLRARIGDEALAWLEGPHAAKRWTRAELIGIRDHYRGEARRLKKQRAQRGGAAG